ncbi:hypothetical protein [Neobacillus cucumis]|uniref:Uncharacterized protein n=1 Tax=Neobacillus cucumis TaxID=1740721 RepID=A0A2N5HA13_9BACI|nr:hypothetical protein [Neobacillus cucumis]PLS02330.1 hypothetical protein CVD27_20330 [Neobacillus cucumis]
MIAVRNIIESLYWIIMFFLIMNITISLTTRDFGNLIVIIVASFFLVCLYLLRKKFLNRTVRYRYVDSPFRKKVDIGLKWGTAAAIVVSMTLLPTLISKETKVAYILGFFLLFSITFFIRLFRKWK